MKLNHFAAISFLMISTAFTTSAIASKSAMVDEISGYVYPENRPESAPEMMYMPDGQSFLAKKSATEIAQYDTKTGAEIAVVMDLGKTRETKISDFSGFMLSDDGSKILLYRDRQNIYRRSFKAKYYIFEIKRNILRPLSQTHPHQQSPVISPDGRVVAFVADNNIYMKKIDYDSEVAVTTDGVVGKIINGATDWTYEEEFSTTSAMVFSPDSQTFCYLKTDETDVPVYTFPLYQGTCDPMNEYALYPGQFSYKYPVAGMPNSKVTLYSYDLSTRKTKEIVFEDKNIEYIPRIIYSSDNDRLLAVTLNREQTRMEIYSVNPKSTVVKSLVVEQYKAWLDPSTYEKITLTPKSLIVFSSRSGYSHLYEYSLTGAMMRQITSGEYDVTDCYGVDAAGNVYYQSTKGNPLNRVVSRVDIKGKVVDISQAEGYSVASFSPDMNYCSLTSSDAVTPPVTKLCRSDGKEVRVLVDNADYKNNLGALPRMEFTKFNSDGYELNGYIIKPLSFDQSRKYPVIMWQYSGPGSQEVLNRWMLDWQYYAASRGFVVVCADGRGTGARGRAFMDVVYRNLGHYETIDQMNVARTVAALPYVDADRIGICGWSYGGYETLMCATASSTPFKAAVAIAPVTDWRYYDTVYTERYMLTPQSNEDGYRASAPINAANNVGCELLIMHGTADDNVHLSNTLEFVSKMEYSGKYCDMLLFPNKNHSIYGCGARAVVYAKMIDYFMKNL